VKDQTVWLNGESVWVNGESVWWRIKQSG